MFADPGLDGAEFVAGDEVVGGGLTPSARAVAGAEGGVSSGRSPYLMLLRESLASGSGWLMYRVE